MVADSFSPLFKSYNLEVNIDVIFTMNSCIEYERIVMDLVIQFLQNFLMVLRCELVELLLIQEAHCQLLAEIGSLLDDVV